MSGLYDEIVVNEIKIENGAADLVNEQDKAASTPKRPGLEGGRQRRRSLSDMFDVAPIATIEEQKSAFEELGLFTASLSALNHIDPITSLSSDAVVVRIGQKMFDVQQRGVKGAPKKVQVGVTGMGITIFDLKGKIRSPCYSELVHRSPFVHPQYFTSNDARWQAARCKMYSCSRWSSGALPRKAWRL